MTVVGGNLPDVGMVAAHLASLALTGYRPTSIYARKGCLRNFAATLAPRGLLNATRLDVEAFLGRDLKPESRRTYRAHLKGFYAWAVEEDYLTDSPLSKIKPVRVPIHAPRPVTEAELLTALASADVRTRAWVALMAFGGLRCIEVAALRPRDVIRSGDRTLLYLRECKGGGEAHVPAHPLVLAALEDVPVRADGVWWDVKPNTISKDVGRYMKAIGVRGGAHRLRHFAGTSWYRASGHDLLATAALLRHRSVTTTMVYAALDPSRGADVVHSVEVAGLRASQPDTEAPRSGLRLVRDQAG